MFHENSSKAASSRSQVLLAEDLRKTYGERTAIRGLSFSLDAGRVLGFLGPNGAGKTTAIRILTTILEPTSGYFFVDGISSEKPNLIRSKIGVLPESLGFPKQMTGLEHLTYYARLYGQTAAAAKANAQALLEEVGMQHRAKSLIGSYSRGMRQRLGIARALINNPVVVFLDEPTLGLDPRGHQELLALVRRIARERNAGVILCSHLLSEIESICDDVVIMSSGQVVANGTVAEVIGRAQNNGAKHNLIRVQVPPSAVATAEKVLAAAPNVKSVTPLMDKQGYLGVDLVEGAGGDAPDKYQTSNKILEAMIRAEVPVLSFEAEGSRLQEVFLQLTEEVLE